MDKPIALHNTPTFYLEFVKNWATHKKKEGASAAELVILDDIAKLIEIAVSALEPAPAPTKTKS